MSPQGLATFLLVIIHSCSFPALSKLRYADCTGQWSDMVVSTIDLGISILMGGNTDVQKVGNAV